MNIVKVHLRVAKNVLKHYLFFWDRHAYLHFGLAWLILKQERRNWRLNRQGYAVRTYNINSDRFDWCYRHKFYECPFSTSQLMKMDWPMKEGVYVKSHGV